MRNKKCRAKYYAKRRSARKARVAKSKGGVSKRCLRAAKARCLKNKRCAANFQKKGMKMKFFAVRCKKSLYAKRAAARHAHKACMKNKACRHKFLGATKRCMKSK